MFSIFFTESEVINYKTALTQDVSFFKKFYQGLLRQKIYLSPSGFETNFLSTAHTTTDIAKTLTSIKKVLESIRRSK